MKIQHVYRTQMPLNKLVAVVTVYQQRQRNTIDAVSLSRVLNNTSHTQAHAYVFALETTLAMTSSNETHGNTVSLYSQAQLHV